MCPRFNVSTLKRYKTSLQDHLRRKLTTDAPSDFSLFKLKYRKQAHVAHSLTLFVVYSHK